MLFQTVISLVEVLLCQAQLGADPILWQNRKCDSILAPTSGGGTHVMHTLGMCEKVLIRLKPQHFRTIFNTGQRFIVTDRERNMKTLLLLVVAVAQGTVQFLTFTNMTISF